MFVYVLLAALPASCLVLYMSAALRHSTSGLITRNAIRLAGLAAHEHELLSHSTHQLLISFAESPAVRQRRARECQNLAERIVKQNSLYTNLGVIGPDGTPLCSAVALDAPGRTFRDFARRTLAAGDFVQGEYRIGNTRAATLSMALPVLDAARTPQAVVFAILGLDWINRLAEAVNLPHTSSLVVFSGEGKILARHPDPEKWVGLRLPESAIFQTILARGDTGAEWTVGVDGVRRLYIYAPLKAVATQRLFLGVAIPHEVAFAEAERVKTRVFFGLALASILMLLAAWFGGDVVLRQVHTLLNVTKRLSAGELSARTGLPPHEGELGVLSRSIDEMAQALQTRQRQLVRATAKVRELNVQLEQRVAARTRQLETANRELAKASQAKSEFLSRMSHELRTPLNTILGFGQLMEMDEVSEPRRRRAQHIITAGHHLLRLINEILDISRIEAGRLTVHLEPVHVGKVLREVMDLLRPMAEERGARLQISETDEWNRSISVDSQRLTQVLLNLLSNAVKYGRRGGQVQVEGVPMGNDRFRIAVHDTGPGIPAEGLERLFEPFERLDADMTGVEGTGLGLALTKRLTEAMGGTIGVTSIAGVGSTFWVEFRLATAAAVDLDGPEPAQPALGLDVSPAKAKTVLYIEDNVANQVLMEEIVSGLTGLTLLMARQGEPGVALARESRPDLILVDLHLPDISGEEVIRRLREGPDTASIPIVVLTADAVPATIGRVALAGIRAYLTKPVDVSRLRAVMSETLEDGSAAEDGRREQEASTHRRR